jgi:hypothetical protein
MKQTFLLPLACIALAAQVPTASAQWSDNFNSGTDSGWTRYNPIAGSTYGFPASSQGGLGYQMSAPTGNGRVGSFFTSMSPIPDGVFSVDLINWSPNVRQEMGVMGRVQTPIPGAAFPSGYSLNYVNRFSAGAGGTDQLRIYKWGAASLSFINQDINGNPNGSVGQFSNSPNTTPPFPGGSPAPLPSGDFRLVLRIYGNVITGQMIDLSTGLALRFSDGLGGSTDTVRAIDNDYTSGIGGLMTFQPGTDPTYDNFSVVPEPSTVALAGLAFLGLVVRKARRA